MVSQLQGKTLQGQLLFRQEHFNISKSDQATFIIYKVTEADEALFTCDVQTNIRNWIDNIQVTVVGKFCFRF